MTNPIISASVPTLVFTTRKKSGETVVKNIITPPIRETGLGITQKEVNNLLSSGAGEISLDTFSALYFCVRGKRISPQEVQALPDMVNVLGVDLQHSPHAVVKVSDDNAADKVAFFIVRSDSPDIVRSHAGGGGSTSTEIRIVTTAAMSAAKARWGRTGDIVSAVLAEVNIRKKRLIANDKPIVIDFTGSNAGQEHVTELQFLLQAVHADIAGRISIVGISA